MPGRVSGRSARSSTAAVSRKSSTATLKSRGSASARTSAHIIEVPDEGPETSLRTRLCQIFGDAQKNNATQKRLLVNLRKIQEACCYAPPKDQKKKVVQEEFDEEHFKEEFTRCVLRVLAVKKGEPVGDRIVRFLGHFLKHATEKDNEIYQISEGEFPETPTSRLTSHILQIVLQFLTAKDKTVRFRSAQIVAHVVNNLTQIDDDLFTLIRLGLTKRLRDKEPSVRVQAILGLGKLADDDGEEDDENSDDDAAGGILNKLLDIMQNDPSAEVRRAVLVNLPFQSQTLRHLLERARDLDPVTRRVLYGNVLPALGDFRHMKLAEREKLLRWGLRDRDELVRKAAGKVFWERWIEDCARPHDPTPEEEKKPGHVAPADLEALLELLERIEVISTGQAGGIAHEAMREFWEGRPDYREYITFDDDYWNQLSPESAFILRSFNDYCRGAKEDRMQDLLEEKFPELTRIAFFMEKYANKLVNNIEALYLQEEDEIDPDFQEEVEGLEFSMEQLLHIAATLDYSDEIGRRQIFKIMREALQQPALPEECTKLVVDVLRITSLSESEFCSIVLEALNEVRDTIHGDTATETGENADESFHSAKSDVSSESSFVQAKSRAKKADEPEDPETEEERRIKEILIYQKCLHIAQCMLQNINCDLESNPQLVLTLNTLVVPAVRNHEAVIRERGVVCLGLCALLSKDLAQNNMQLFLHCYNQSENHETLRISCVQILSDILITHPFLLAPLPQDPDQTETQAVNPLLKPVTKVFLKAFRSDNAGISLTACTAASKLLLLNVLPPTSVVDILKDFTIAYFNPNTATNPALRQALSYFLPVFCHSRQQNALIMAKIAIIVVQKLLVMRDGPDDEEQEMVGWPIVAGHLAEWTDGRKVVGATELGLDGKMEIAANAEESHIALSIEVLERVLSNSCSKDERKPLLTLLGKLHVSATKSTKGETVDEDSLRTLHSLASEAVENKLGLDATSRNYLAKLEHMLTKRLGNVEHVTQIQDGENEQAEIAREDGDTGMQRGGEEEDTVLAGMQAEGTRFPLGSSEEDDEEEITVVGKKIAVTEDDIVDSLLESEI
ncbi:hypothetical protein CC78DRAFT_512532 [Lojkania enalia]|uniref:Nuclear condensin complex subunit 3 C-terminal domain-containing protein n=1 Tax=Lojkania enalia TaxID=147567 RepID=A0A9P4N5M2_9PLEO|nr:hypothetical protein CC78DRAFT_512532 [Didymosphaeria enalia]